MGVTTRGGARACVVDTGSTATRANAPPARGAAHTGAEREARGVVRDKQRRGLEVAEGPGAVEAPMGAEATGGGGAGAATGEGGAAGGDSGPPCKKRRVQ